MAMDANELRQKLKSLEALMSNLLSKDPHHHQTKDRIIADSAPHRARREGVVGLRCQGDGFHGDRSNGSPSSSWETTMCGLAKELETICSAGSSPRDSPNASLCLTPTNPDAPSRRTFSCGSNGGGGGGRMSHQGSLFDADDSGPPCPCSCPSGARTVRVRHEETEERLDRSLTMICRHNVPEQQPGDKATDSSRGTKYRDSVKYGLRFRVDLTGRDPDQTTVSVDTEDRILRVHSAGETIHLLQLAENTDPRTLSCNVIDDGATLFIRQRSKETMCIEIEAPPPPRPSSSSTSSSSPSSSTSSSTSFSSSEVGLPVVRNDEQALTTTVTLRLPACLHGNDDAAVVVKTIDDTLVIRVGVTTAPGPLHPDTVDGPGAGVGEARFCVVMNLPEGTDSRSVCAWAAKGQLTVKGRLVPASRRMTCTF